MANESPSKGKIGAKEAKAALIDELGSLLDQNAAKIQELRSGGFHPLDAQALRGLAEDLAKKGQRHDETPPSSPINLLWFAQKNGSKEWPELIKALESWRWKLLMGLPLSIKKVHASLGLSKKDFEKSPERMEALIKGQGLRSKGLLKSAVFRKDEPLARVCAKYLNVREEEWREALLEAVVRGGEKMGKFFAEMCPGIHEYHKMRAGESPPLRAGEAALRYSNSAFAEGLRTGGYDFAKQTKGYWADYEAEPELFSDAQRHARHELCDGSLQRPGNEEEAGALEWLARSIPEADWEMAKESARKAWENRDNIQTTDEFPGRLGMIVTQGPLSRAWTDNEASVHFWEKNKGVGIYANALWMGNLRLAKFLEKHFGFTLRSSIWAGKEMPVGEFIAQCLETLRRSKDREYFKDDEQNAQKSLIGALARLAKEDLNEPWVKIIIKALPEGKGKSSIEKLMLEEGIKKPRAGKARRFGI